MIRADALRHIESIGRVDYCELVDALDYRPDDTRRLWMKGTWRINGERLERFWMPTEIINLWTATV